MKKIIALITFGVCFSTAAAASPVTFSFSATDEVLPYSENGFTLTGNALDGAAGACPGGPTASCNDPFRVVTGVFYSSFTFIDGGLTQGGLRAGEGADFTKDGGGLFSLTSFKYRSALNNAGSDNLTDAFDIIGLRNGSEVVDFGNFATSSGAFLTEITGDATLVDTLRVIGTQTNRASPIWDDFVFDVPVNPIPVPASLPLLAAGLLSFVCLRRKKRN